MAIVNEEVAGLVIPMSGRPMLVPNVTVAEIVDWQEPSLVDNSPHWYLGEIDWRGVNIPLLSLELMNSPDDDDLDVGTRIAVLNGVGQTKNNFYAVCVQGIPRLVRVYPSEMGSEETLSNAPAFHMMVNVSGENVVIPNLDYVEQQIAAHC